MGLSKRRPVRAMRCARRPACIGMVGAGDVQTRLRELLDWLQFWKEGEAVPPRGGAAATRDDAAGGASGGEGPLSWLRFWQRHEGEARQTAEQLRDVGAGLKEGKLDVLRERASLLDFSWLFPRKAESNGKDEGPMDSPAGPPPRSGLRDDFVEIERRAAALGAFLADALCPWDYDRRELSLTFTNSWTDVQKSQVARGKDALVKITSTIKPLYQEWKLTARTKLMTLGEGGVLFGKAGLFLAGDAPAYVGLEADRVVDVPRLKGTKLFANANYRSSRKPFAAPVVASLGVQQTVPLRKGLEFTFRFGISTKSSTHVFFVSPVPYGTYF